MSTAICREGRRGLLSPPPGTALRFPALPRGEPPLTAAGRTPPPSARTAGLVVGRRPPSGDEGAEAARSRASEK